MCCFSQLSLLTEQLAHLIRIDPFVVLPHELGLKVLQHLDATSLCRAAQVSKRWRALADDDVLWRGICEQHIGQKCTKCGWGLPILEKRRAIPRLSPVPPSTSPSPAPESPQLQPPQPSASVALLAHPLLSLKRSCEDRTNLSAPPLKRQRSEDPYPGCSLIDSFSSLLTTNDMALRPSVTRPWKDVYSERLTVERNWRRGRCTIKTLKGHTDGVMCLQFSETLQHPAFPILITGSYDRTARVWNMETGVELHCLRGHTRAVRSLQFDEVKLITGSMDNSIKVWDWRSGKCIRTLTGHTEGVVCLNFDSNVLASGSVDATVKVWNLRTGGAFTLRGHSDWVNSVQLWDSNAQTGQKLISDSSVLDGSLFSASSTSHCPLQIDPGKMLFSASDDGTIRLWDLTQRSCVRQFTGHVGQVQSMKLLVDDCDSSGEVNMANSDKDPTLSNVPDDTSLSVERKKPLLISGSLDNTVKLWDIETGETVRTFFGHIEGVWAVASDKLRLVSGSHDRTIKVCLALMPPIFRVLTSCV